MYFLYFVEPSTLDSHRSGFFATCLKSAYQTRTNMDFAPNRKLQFFMEKLLENHTIPKKNSRLCSIYYTINWNFIICAAIVSWKTWLPLLILNNFFLFLISKFWRPQTTQCGLAVWETATTASAHTASIREGAGRRGNLTTNHHYTPPASEIIQRCNRNAYYWHLLL